MMHIQTGLPENFRGAAAALFIDALGDKFAPILGVEKKAYHLIEQSIQCDNCICAIGDGELLGVLAIQTADTQFLDPSFEILMDTYGLVGGIHRALKLSVLAQEVEKTELHIEAIAVAKNARGKGIGTQLLNELFSMAAIQQIATVSLQVISTNENAMALYQRLGFVVGKKKGLWPVNRWVGWEFSEITSMTRNIC